MRKIIALPIVIRDRRANWKNTITLKWNLSREKDGEPLAK